MDRKSCRSRTSAAWETRVALIFLLPHIIGFLVFTLFPSFFSLLLSTFSWDIMTPLMFVGLQNFVRLFSDPLFYKVLRNTAFFVLISVPLGMIFSLILALLVNVKLKYIVFFRTAFFMPKITSMVAVALVWTWIFNPDFGWLNSILDQLRLLDPINSLLGSIGLPPLRWLTSPIWAMPAIIIVSVWKNLGYSMIMYLAGLQGISDMYYEAAEIDGASWWQKFRYVTLPMLSPTTFFVLVMSIIGSFQVFEQVFIMTRGGQGISPGGPLDSTNTIVLYIYTHAFTYFQMGYASAVAWILFIIIFTFTLLQWRFQKKWVHYG